MTSDHYKNDLPKEGEMYYDYLRSWNKFNNKSFLSNESILGELNNLGITDQDWGHAQKMWNKFKINNLDEY